jgi:hypothetical protein
MIRPKSPKDGQWQKNEKNMPQQCVEATFEHLMASTRKAGPASGGVKTRPFEIQNQTVQTP